MTPEEAALFSPEVMNPAMTDDGYLKITPELWLALGQHLSERNEIITQHQAELVEREHSFDLRRKADMRAIKYWQEATGRYMVFPDHADLCCWLMAENDRLQGIIPTYEKEEEYLREKVGRLRSIAEEAIELVDESATQSWRKTGERLVELRRALAEDGNSTPA